MSPLVLMALALFAQVRRTWRASTFLNNRGPINKKKSKSFLSRHPMPDELAAAEAYFRTPGIKPAEAANDVAWALINSKEFLYRH